MSSNINQELIQAMQVCCYSCGGISLVANTILIVAVYKSRLISSSYRIQQYISAIICFLYSCFMFITVPAVLILPEELTVLLYRTSVVKMDQLVGRIFLVIFVFDVMMTALSPALQFIYRYLTIAYFHRQEIWSSCCTRLILLFPIAFSYGSAIMVTYTMWPNQPQMQRYDQRLQSANGGQIAAYLISTMKIVTNNQTPVSEMQENTQMKYSVWYVVSTMVIENIANIFFFVKIRQSLAENIKSKRTSSLMRQLLYALSAQAFLPLLLVHLPVNFGFVAPIQNIQLGIFPHIIILLLPTYSAIIPWITLLYVKDVRKNMVKMFGLAEYSSDTHSTARPTGKLFSVAVPEKRKRRMTLPH